MAFGLRKRWRGLDASIVIGDSGVDTGRCTDEPWHFLCACTVVFPLEDQSRWLWHHEMISHDILGGHYKKRAHLSLRAVIWVFRYWMVGSIDKSQTLYSSYLGVSHGAQHNQKWTVCFIYPYTCTQTFLGNFYSVWLQLFDVSWVGHYLHTPWTWYQAKHGSQPFGSGLQEQDKSLAWCESLPIHLAYLCTCIGHISGILGWALHFSTLST